jgi:hypothetical protein
MVLLINGWRKLNSRDCIVKYKTSFIQAVKSAFIALNEQRQWALEDFGRLPVWDDIFTVLPSTTQDTTALLADGRPHFIQMKGHVDMMRVTSMEFVENLPLSRRE